MMAKWKTIFESQLQAFLRQIQPLDRIERIEESHIAIAIDKLWTYGIYCSFSGFDSYSGSLQKLFHSWDGASSSQRPAGLHSYLCYLCFVHPSLTCADFLYHTSGKNPKLAMSTFWRTWRHAWTIMSTTPLYWTQAGNAGMQRESCLNPPEHWIERDTNLRWFTFVNPALHDRFALSYIVFQRMGWDSARQHHTARLTLRDHKTTID